MDRYWQNYTIKSPQAQKVIFALGVIVLATALLLRAPASSSLSAQTDMVERNAAIQAAIKAGKTNYSYTTNFVPGLGYQSPTQNTAAK